MIDDTGKNQGKISESDLVRGNPTKNRKNIEFQILYIAEVPNFSISV